MKTRRPLASRLPGVTWNPDPLRRVHVQFDDRAMVFEPYFDEVCKAWIERTLALSPAADLALSAIVAEMVIDPEQLPPFLSALSDAFLSRGQPWVIWPTVGGRIDARRLSDQTVTLIASLQGKWPADWSVVLDELSEHLGATFPRMRLRAAPSRIKPLQALLRGAAAYATALPGVLLHHLVGLQTLTPPDRSTFARIEAQQPLAPQAEAEDDADAAMVTESIEAVAVDIGNEADSAIDFSLMDELKAGLSSKVRGGYGKQRRRALDMILRKAARAATTEAAIVMLFPAHMLTVGTLQRRRASMRNVRAYNKVLVEALKACPQALRAMLSDEPTEAFAAYQRLLSAKTAGRRELRKAIGAFQAYLVHRFDAPTVSLGRNAPDPDPIPAAHYIDEATIERLLGRIKSSTANDRVIEMATCMLLLALDLPSRISDFWRVRIADVVSHGDAIVVDFKAHRNEDAPKTLASIAAVEMKSVPARAAMVDWRKRRLKESVGTSERLFGDGYNKPTMQHAMEAYQLLNRLLKEVTGDRRVSFHSLRHTAISNQVDAALCRPNESSESDPAHAVSARARHASTATTLRTYTHLYAQALRMAIDRRLYERMNHRIVARWTGLNESTLSKRARGRDAREVWAEAIRARASRVFIPGADVGVAFAQLSPPSPPSLKIALADILQILEFLAKGDSPAQVAERSGLPIPVCENIEKQRQALKAHGVADVEELHWGTPKLAGILQVVSGSPNSPLVKRAAEACVDLTVDHYLDASVASRIDPVLQLLRHARFSPALLLLRSDDRDSASWHECLHLISLRFSAHPNVEGVKPERSHRPGVYLMLMSQPAVEGEPVGPRNACTRGLLHLMSAALVYQRVSSSHSA